MKMMTNDGCHHSPFVAMLPVWQLVKDRWKGGNMSTDVGASTDANGDVAPGSNVNKWVKRRVYEHWCGLARMKMNTMTDVRCCCSLFVATSVMWQLVKDEWKGGNIAPSSNVNKWVKGRVYEHWCGSAHMKSKNDDQCCCLSSGCHIAPGSDSKKWGGRTCEDWCGLVRMKTMNDDWLFIVWLPRRSQWHGTWFRW